MATIALGQRLDRLALGVVEVGEAAGEARQLAGAHVLGPLVELGDERRRLAGGDLDGEPLELLGDDRADAVGLAGAQGEAAVGPVAQVVEVEQRDAVELGDGAVDRARARRCRRSAAARPAGGSPRRRRGVTTL